MKMCKTNNLSDKHVSKCQKTINKKQFTAIKSTSIMVNTRSNLTLLEVMLLT